MGPRFNGVEDVLPLYLPNGCDLLQWGHALMAWKTTLHAVMLDRMKRLQWGHALMAWKTVPHGVANEAKASRFNGATL